MHLTLCKVETPLGNMSAISDEKALVFLGFHAPLHQENLIYGKTAILQSIEEELFLYFTNRLTHFQTPLRFEGSPLQTDVWNALLKIPYGTTLPYASIATAIHRKEAVRAVARAIGQNPLSIIIPCHRVIRKDGSLGGFSGGIENKQRLLHHETMFR